MAIKLFLTIFLCLTIQVLSQNQQCKPIVNSYNIYPIIEETQTFSLEKLFIGQNMTYSFQNKFDYGEIYNALYKKAQSISYQVSAIDVDVQYNEEIDADVCSLVIDPTNNYWLGFAQVNVTQTPDFSVQRQITSKTNAICYSSAYITDDIAVADCVVQGDPTNTTQLYLVSQVAIDPAYNNTGAPVASYFYSRQSLNYINNQQTFLINYVPYNQFASPTTENYIDIYWFNSTVDTGLPFGSLTYVYTVKETDLKITNPNNLQIVNVQAGAGYIIVQDLKLGVFVFQFDKDNNVTNVQNFQLLKDQTEIPLGMTITAIGKQTLMIYATDKAAYEYFWANLQQPPKLLQTYADFSPAGSSGLAIPGVNVGYVAVQYNGLLTIYKRGNSEILSSTKVDYFAIIGADSLAIFYNNQATIYDIINPTLGINFDKAPPQSQNNFVLVATSYNFDVALTCQINFVANYITDASPKDMYYTGIAPNTNVDEVIDAYTITIPLGVSYVGSNLSYSLNVQQIVQQEEVEVLENVQEAVKVNQNPSFLVEKNENKNSNYRPKTLREQFPNLVMNVTSNVPDYTTLSFNGILPESVTYISLFAVDEDTYLALIQLKEYIVKVYTCNGNLVNQTNVYDKLVCTNPNNYQTQLDGQIYVFDSAYSQELQKSVWAASTLKSPNNITGFDFQCNLIDTPKQFSAGDQILDIMILNDLIYILVNQTDASKIIYINVVDTTLDPYLVISNQQVQSYLPQGETFNPQALLGNKDQPGILFIQQSNFIMILSISEQMPLFLSNLMIDFPQGQNCQAFITSQNLITVCDGANGFINEYTLLDLTLIIQTKSYLQYGWTIYSPLTASFSWGTQMLYIMMTQGTDMYSVFVYKPNLPLIQTLYKSLYFNSTTLVNPYMIVNGIDVDGLFVLYNTSYYNFFRVPQDSSYIVSINVTNSTNYLSQFTINETVQSINGKTNSAQQSISIINSFQQVAVNSEINKIAINKLNKQLEIKNNSQFPITQQFDDSNWYSGQVFSQQLSYQDQDPKTPFFTLINHLSVQNTTFNASLQGPAVDIYTDSKSNIYFLSSNSISILNSQLQFVTNFTLQQANQCIKLVPQTDINGNLINLIALCLINTVSNAIVVNVTDPKAITQNIISIQQVQVIGDAYYMNNNLVILDQKQGIVYAFNIDQTPALVTATYNAANLQITEFQVNLTSFVIWNITKDLTTLVFTNKYLYVIGIQVNSSDFSQILYNTVIQAQAMLQQFQLALPTQEQLLKIVLTSTVQNNTSAAMQLLFFTQNVGIITVQIWFDLTKPNIPTSDFNVTTVYASFGQDAPVSRVSIYYHPYIVGEGLLSGVLDPPITFSVAYYNQQQQQVTLSVYSNLKLPQPNKAAPKVDLETMVGGIQVKVTDPNSFAFAFMKNPNNILDEQPNLFCSLQSSELSVQQINYNPSMTILINNNKWPISEQLFFTPFSIFGNTNLNYSVNATQIIVIPPSNSDDGGMKWYYWLIIGIGAVLLIGIIIGIVIYLKKKKSAEPEDDDQLIEEDKEKNTTSPEKA